jgi:transcriptional regulator with XRE-family HTH domain
MKNDLLRRAREIREWTQPELAEKLGVAVRTVRAWERGDNSPIPLHRSRLCDLFDMTPAQLGLEEDETGQQPQEEVQTVGTTAEQDPKRRMMLNRVRTFWISGILDQVLAQDQGTFIHLRLQECPTVVRNPWSAIAQELNLPSRSLAPETGILDVYDEVNGGLLILGSPGAGKTTLLLSLARSLLARADRNPAHPMPVVFNLASWAEKRLELRAWLVDELQVKYLVPRSLAASWVSANHILPLLDGLDEVVGTSRADCVQAINAYRKEHGFVPMVVCCRDSEYLALNAHIALEKAVSIEPLGSEEIANYISKAGKSLQGVQMALKSDSGLREMASTPLMLQIIAQTFRVTSIKALLSVQDEARRRALIFEKYIEVVLKRRGSTNRYSPEQTIHWLSRLAQQMQKHNQTEFSVERMQPDWLPDDRARVRYRNMVIRLVFSLNVLIVSGLFALFRGDSAPDKPGLFFWLGAGGKGNEILEWMRPGLAFGLQGAGSLDLLMVVLTSLIALLINMRRIPILSPHAVQIGLFNGLRSGLLVGGPVGCFSGFIFALRGGAEVGFYRGISTGLFAALIIFLLIGLKATLRSGSSEQPYQAHLGVVNRLVNGIIFCVCGMVSFILVYSVQAGELALAIKYGAVVGIANATYAFSDTIDLIRGVGVYIEPAEVMTWSWRSVMRNLGDSAYKAGLVTVFVITMTVGVFASVACLSYQPSYGLRYGLFYGLMVGIIIGTTIMLTQILTSGWSSSILPGHQRIRPNWGITRSARNSLLAALLSGPPGGMMSGGAIALSFKVVAGLAGWQILGLGFALILGIEFTVQIALAYGSIAVLEHYVLRWYLWRFGDMPLNYVAFLDYAVERILLRRVGGDYMFSHRLLLEYFSSLETHQFKKGGFSHV